MFESADSIKKKRWNNMNLKRTLTTLLAVIMVFSISASAFAESTDIKPTVVGIADTRETALSYIPGNSYSLFLSDSNDKDWYKWTNTGSGRFILVYLQPQGENIKFRMGIEIVHKDGTETSRFYAPTLNGNGYGMYIRNLYVPEGATVYAVIDSTEFIAQGQYTFMLDAY